MSHSPHQIIYSIATKQDLDQISTIHIKSWRKHYKGILSDRYLDQEIDEERRNLWESRFAKANPNQIIIKAEAEGRMIGFACHFLNYDKTYGHYLDNLHVLPEYQKLGIGKALILLSAKHCQQFNDLPYYLWVFSANTDALGFYSKLGGHCIKEEPFDAPDGNTVNAKLIQWRDSLSLF